MSSVVTSEPGSPDRIHIRQQLLNQAFTLSIIKTTLYVILIPNISPLFDDDKQCFITRLELQIIKTFFLSSKLQTSCSLIPQQVSFIYLLRNHNEYLTHFFARKLYNEQTIRQLRQKCNYVNTDPTS